MSSYASLFDKSRPSLLAVANVADSITERLAELCLQVDSREARALDGALSVAVGALAGLQKALTNSAALTSDPMFSRDYKIQQATTMINQAQTAATNALDVVVSAAQACRAKLEARYQVSAPKGDAAQLLAFTAEQMARLLETRVGDNAGSLPSVVSDLLSDALARKADAEVYVLVNALWPTYSRLGGTPGITDAVRSQVAAAIAASRNESPDDAGAALLAELGDGGSLVKWAQSVRHMVAHLAQPALDGIRKDASLGLYQDGPISAQEARRMDIRPRGSR